MISGPDASGWVLQEMLFGILSARMEGATPASCIDGKDHTVVLDLPASRDSTNHLHGSWTLWPPLQAAKEPKRKPKRVREDDGQLCCWTMAQTSRSNSGAGFEEQFSDFLSFQLGEMVILSDAMCEVHDFLQVVMLLMPGICA